MQEELRQKELDTLDNANHATKKQINGFVFEISSEFKNIENSIKQKENEFKIMTLIQKEMKELNILKNKLEAKILKIKKLYEQANF
ncbi:hypothetical protein [Helicobacter sp. 10-6591]|uniref:hypothetical protein n=1 Tax=Helicobacter sp. 10-6591 TaxID=2004998 RepID=UPI000DCD1B6E|nr:hypothetical protein [Helicobacter sp. 10-6591]RAX55460.1 hypothetical protein CCY97_04130 [Helicobacter sp. 10-6591]